MSGLKSGFCLAYFALPLKRGTFLHLETHGVDGTGNHRSRGKTTGIEVAITDDFSLDDGFLGLEVPVYRGVLTDRQAPLGGDVPLDGTVENEIG